MSNEKTFDLAYPLEIVDGEITRQIEAVTLRRPKAKDLRALDGAGDGKMDQAIVMVSICSGLTVEQVEELDGEDFITLSEAVADFFPAVSPRTNGGQ